LSNVSGSISAASYPVKREALHPHILDENKRIPRRGFGHNQIRVQMHGFKILHLELGIKWFINRLNGLNGTRWASPPGWAVSKDGWNSSPTGS